jgi:energy-converting hydrogenase Eha subunit C
MTLSQSSACFTAAISSVLFFMAARREPDKIIKIAQYVWALVMLTAASAYPLMAFTDSTWVRSVAQMMTPIGWGSLAIIAARRYSINSGH